jgi:hypothetical protein
MWVWYLLDYPSSSSFVLVLEPQKENWSLESTPAREGLERYMIEDEILSDSGGR